MLGTQFLTCNFIDPDDSAKVFDSWDDFKMILLDRPIFASPELKKDYVPVPGRDGDLDFSEALTGYPVYKDREGDNFNVRIYGPAVYGRSAVSRIMNSIHGRRLKLVLNDEPDYYWIGRFYFDDPAFLQRYKEWVDGKVAYKVEPYKYETTDSVEDYLWDTFSLNDGVVRGYTGITVGGPTTFQADFGPAAVVPAFNVSNLTGTMVVSIDGTTYSLQAGSNIFPSLRLEGAHDLLFNVIGGTGTVEILFRGKSL